MNVAYLVWLENLRSPILSGQVIEVLETMARASSGHRFHLFAFQPLHRVILRRNHLAEVRRRLRRAGVETVVIPCLAIPHVDLFRARWFLMPFILLQSLPALLVLALAKRIDILHCRSYPAAWAAMVLRRILPLRLVFDPRSDFPEESVTAGKWSSTSLTHRAWKNLERRLLEEADATVAITRTYVDHYVKAAPGARFYLVPNNVDTVRFRRDDAFRQAFRQEHGLDGETLVFCYSGSMGGHWHRPGPYADFIVGLRELGMAHWFLIITTEPQAIREPLQARGVRSEEYGIVSCAFEEVGRYLSAADFGTMFLPAPKIALGIKAVEYMAAGLPLVVNRKSAGAVEIVERYGVGLVVDDERAVDWDALRRLAEKRDEVSAACRKLAETRFSNSVVADRYLQLYSRLTS